MTVSSTVEVAIADRLRRRGAQDRLDALRRSRDIVDASRSGVPHHAISELLGTVSQATVTRLLKRCAGDPNFGRETPAEVIDRRVAGEIDRVEMMRSLLQWRYTYGDVPSIDGEATDAYVTGDWDQIVDAYYRDLITQEEFDVLSARQGELIDRWSRPR